MGILETLRCLASGCFDTVRCSRAALAVDSAMWSQRPHPSAQDLISSSQKSLVSSSQKSLLVASPQSPEQQGTVGLPHMRSMIRQASVSPGLPPMAEASAPVAPEMPPKRLSKFAVAQAQKAGGFGKARLMVRLGGLRMRNDENNNARQKARNQNWDMLKAKTFMAAALGANARENQHRFDLRLQRQRSKMEARARGEGSGRYFEEVDEEDQSVKFWEQGDSEMYSQDNLDRRFSLRHEPEVRDMLREWWSTVQRLLRKLGKPTDKLYETEYKFVFNKIYKLMMPAEEFDVAEVPARPVPLQPSFAPSRCSPRSHPPAAYYARPHLPRLHSHAGAARRPRRLERRQQRRGIPHAEHFCRRHLRARRPARGTRRPEAEDTVCLGGTGGHAMPYETPAHG